MSKSYWGTYVVPVKITNFLPLSTFVFKLNELLLEQTDSVHSIKVSNLIPT